MAASVGAATRGAAQLAAEARAVDSPPAQAKLVAAAAAAAAAATSSVPLLGGARTRRGRPRRGRTLAPLELDVPNAQRRSVIEGGGERGGDLAHLLPAQCVHT